MPGTVAPVRWTIWFWPALIATLVLDLASKYIVFAQDPRSLPGWMRLDYNEGVAWSMLRDHPGFVALLTAVLIPVLAWVWWRGYRQLGWPENLAFGLILGGALGNGYDRALAVAGVWPGVRDFIHINLGFWPCAPWPTFNIADSGISIGFVLLLARAFLPQVRSEPASTASTSPPCS